MVKLEVSYFAGVRTLAYEQGRLKSESYAGGPFDGYVLERSYDGLQRYSGLTVGAINYQASYGYDAASRLQTVWWGAAESAGVSSFSYAYHPHSSLVYTLKANNGTEDVLTTTKFWDKLNRLTSISASSIGPDSELLYAYAHNDLNQRTQAVREDGSYWDYAYDDRGQLTLGQKKSSGGSVLSGFDLGYDYDFIGNRKSADSDQQTQVYQANALNQYTAITGHGTLAHDADGNLTASGAGWAYEYDGENRLISAESATTRLEHYYDGQSRRFATEVYGVAGVGNYQLLTTTYYLFDGWNLIHEQSVVHGSPTATAKTYLWGLDVSGSLQGAGGVGGLLAMSDEESGALAAYAYDGNGNVSRLYDVANGAVVASYEYDPFGNTISQSGSLATTNPFRFSTKYLDESGLYYYGYRYYSASMGRWLNRDPIGEAGGVNVYGFVGNQPINSIDILGLDVAAAPAVSPTTTGGTYSSGGGTTMHYLKNGARPSTPTILRGSFLRFPLINVVLGVYFGLMERQNYLADTWGIPRPYGPIGEPFHPYGERQTMNFLAKAGELDSDALEVNRLNEQVLLKGPRVYNKKAESCNRDTGCKFIWDGLQLGSWPEHDAYAQKIFGNDYELIVITPDGDWARYDGGWTYPTPVKNCGRGKNWKKMGDK